MLKSIARSSSVSLQRQSRRSFAVATAPFEYNRKGDQASFAPPAVKSISKTSSGLTVATHDGRGPVSSLAIVIGAGSRHETTDAPGVAHFLKNALIRNVPGDNIVRQVRELELRGDTLYTSLNREQITIASSFLRDDLVDIVPLLVNHVFNPSFQPYEFLDAIPNILSESAASLADPSTKIFDTLHQTAFRTGLGNSLFASTAGVKALKRSHLQDFAANNIASGRLAIVGTGIAHEELTALVESSLKGFSVPTSAASVKPSTYFGGESRIEAGPKSASQLAIAFKSAAFTSAEYPAALVLRALLDGSQRLKWGSTSGVTGLLSKAATSSADVTAFEASYTDAGLIGFYVVGGDAAEVKSVAQKSIDAFKSVAGGSGISADALARAKKAAIIDSEAGTFASRDLAIQEIGRSVLATGSYRTSGELATAISGVTVEDVVKVAKTAVSSKPSIVSYGNLLKMPYADEFKF
ncbi:hypothetical protein HDU76_004503 [Blyttiomyces sp. JEL0837]|nr:hypothetical protein HDU76_004503 [Blyttiomyces sp. JEL0837]